MRSANRWCDQCELLTPTQASAKPCLVEWSHAFRSRMALSFSRSSLPSCAAPSPGLVCPLGVNRLSTASYASSSEPMHTA